MKNYLLALFVACVSLTFFVARTEAANTPTAPQNLVATSTPEQVSLSWNTPASDGGSAITQYIVYYWPIGSSTINQYTVSSSQLSYTVTGLIDSTSYDFEVAAQNSVGISLPSNIVSETPQDILSFSWNSVGITNLSFNGQTFETAYGSGASNLQDMVFVSPSGASSSYSNQAINTSIQSSDSDSFTQVYRQGESDSFTLKQVFSTSTNNTLEIDTYVTNNDTTDTIQQFTASLLPTFTIPGTINNVPLHSIVYMGKYYNAPTEMFQGSWGSLDYWLGDYTVPDSIGGSFDTNSVSGSPVYLYVNNNSAYSPTGFGAIQTDQPYDEILPKQTLEIKSFIRFSGSTTTTAAQLAPEAYSMFSNEYPYLVNWPDRRPISELNIASNYDITDVNPLGYFNPSFDEVDNSQSYFDAQVLSVASNTIAVLNATVPRPQAVIVWDLEGEEFQQVFTLVGSPDKLNLISPEMDAVADQMMSMYKNAGYRVGMVIRPSSFLIGTLADMPATCNSGGSTDSNLDDVYIATDAPYPYQGYVCYPQNTWVVSYAEGPAFQTVVNREDVELANIETKVRYAEARWGMKLFHIDSPVYSDSGNFAFTLLRRLQQDFPDALFLPENFSAPASRYSASPPWMNESAYPQYEIPDYVRDLYPNAFQITGLENLASTTFASTTVFNQLVDGARKGDIMMYNGWWFNDGTLGMEQVAASSGVSFAPYDGSSYVPPSPVSDFSAASVGKNSAVLSWTAPGNHADSGTASSYDIRYSTSPITQSNWLYATAATVNQTPQSSGSAETYTLSGLSPNTTYYAAIETNDNYGDTSDISSLAAFTTSSPSAGTSYTSASGGFGGSSSIQTLTVATAGLGVGIIASNPEGIICGEGAYYCTGSYASGSTVILSTTAQAGSHLVSWTNCTSVSGTSCTVVVGSNLTVSANFGKGVSTAPVVGINTGFVSSPARIAASKKGTTNSGSTTFAATPTVPLATPATASPYIVMLAGSSSPEQEGTTTILSAPPQFGITFEIESFWARIVAFVNGVLHRNG